MARGFIGNIQKQAQVGRLSLKGVNKFNIEKENELPTSTTLETSTTSAIQPKKKNFLIPIAIGGGVLVIGVLLYFTFRKK